VSPIDCECERSVMDWTKYENFSADEFACQCGCGQVEMDPDFIQTLQEIRKQFGPMAISSGYRCRNHPVERRKKGKNPGAHVTGQACDVRVYGESAWRLLRVTANFPEIRGIGVSQKGDRKRRFIHLDTTAGTNRPWIWSY
jgi:zinc D-Ala-D-Ala carboxypeptidase